MVATMDLNNKNKYSVCSAITNIEEHEKFKQQKLEVKLKKLLLTLKTYGAKSNEFYSIVKPFIMKTLHRYIPYNLFNEDLVNNSYMKLIIAFEGGWQKTKKGEPVFKKPYFDINKCKNIGNFIFTITRNEATRFLTSQKKLNLNDNLDDFINKIDLYEDVPNAQILEVKEYTFECPYKFKRFKFNNEFIKHLQSIRDNAPKNNVFYNLLTWEEAAC